MLRFASILLILLCGAIRFDRDGDRLKAYDSHGAASTSETIGGISINLETFRVSLSAQGWNEDGELVSFYFSQNQDFTCIVQESAPEGKGIAREWTYKTFADALDGDDYIVRSFFGAIEQPKVLCSRRWLRLRNGTEGFYDPEIECAVEHYLGLADSDSPRVRNDATDALSRLGENGAYYLLMRDKQDLSFEQRSRVQFILQEYP